jgi:SynChlorMet cassette radical SAM/SPASM protein ScmF
MSAPALPPSIPYLYHLYVYPNEECNLACKHCWITAKLATTVRSRKVSSADYVRLVDQALPLGLGIIAISGGEALMSKDEVLALIEYAGSKGVAVRIETNGTLIDDRTAAVLAKARAQCSVSIDGATAESHERMRKVPGCFDETMRGLEVLRKHNVSTEIIMSVSSENIGDLYGVACIAATMPRGHIKINPIVPSGRGKMLERKGERLRMTPLYEWIKTLERERHKYPVPIIISAEPAFRSLADIKHGLASGDRCGFKNLLGILASGEISFCGMGYKARQYVFGNVFDLDLADLWINHPVLNEVRRQVPDKLEGICGNCVMRATCQGACRASAYEFFRSITAPSPGCQQLYEEGHFPKTRMIDPDKDCRYTAPQMSLPVVNSVVH